MTHKRLGFTLIELSIVLVIIGLISGGVLVGRDLIHAAQIRAQVTQIEKLDAAVMTFRGKYGCLPGDCMNAANLGVAGPNFGWNGIAGDGDGDWLISGGVHYPFPMYGPESINFWHALVLAKLIDHSIGSTTYPYLGNTTPKTKLPGRGFDDPFLGPASNGMWIAGPATMSNFEFPPRHGWLMAAWIFNTPPAPADLPAGLFLPLETYEIDVKIDDGFPETGKMVAATGVDTSQLLYRDTVSTTAQPDACVNDAPPHDTQPVYNMAITERTPASLCLPIVAASF